MFGLGGGNTGASTEGNCNNTIMEKFTQGRRRCQAKYKLKGTRGAEKLAKKTLPSRQYK